VAPNLLWCGDPTEIVTDEGKLYLASVLDLFSRKCLGHAFSAHHDADHAEAALLMGIANRGGDVKGIIFHSASMACDSPHGCSPDVSTNPVWFPRWDPSGTVTTTA
jgi:transposase InsO family protein